MVAVLLSVAVGVAVLWDGGFSPPARVAFAALACVALLAAAVVDRRRVAGLVREPVVLVLLALAALGAASAAWTMGFVGDAWRWGLVAASYAGIVVVAATIARAPRGVEVVAGVVCVCALASGAVGLVAAAAHAGPFATRVGGAWRPGGTLEYPPALALLQVSALPALLTAMRRGSRAVRGAAALGGAVAVAVLALSGSRTGVGFAVVVCVVGVVRSGGADGRVGRAASRLGRAPRSRRSARARHAAAALGVAMLLAAVAATAVATGGAHAPATHDGGFWHGRLHTWRAAAATAADRPLTGAGADAFLAASARHQREGPVRFAHDLPLELAAELGVLGALLGLALYATAGAVVWRARASRAAWLLGPAVLAFLASSLVDWPWHLAGSGAVWSAALGGVIGGVRAPG